MSRLAALSQGARVPIKNLHPHPLNARLYGTNYSGKEWDEFVEDVRKYGIRVPLSISTYPLGGVTGTWILSGHRRCVAAMQLGMQDVPVHIEHVSGVDAEEFLVSANKQRTKTKEQIFREYAQIKQMESERAKERKVSGLKQGDKSPVGAKSDTREKGRASNKAARRLGIKAGTAEKGAKLVQKADEGDKKARAALDEVNKGAKSIDAAHREVIGNQAQRRVPTEVVQVEVSQDNKVLSHVAYVHEVKVAKPTNETVLIETGVLTVDEALRKCLVWFESLLKSVTPDHQLQLYEQWISKLGDELEFFKAGQSKLAKQAACPHVNPTPVKGKSNRYHCDSCGASFDRTPEPPAPERARGASA